MKTTLDQRGQRYRFDDLLILSGDELVDYQLEVVMDAAETDAMIVNKAIVFDNGNLKLRGLIKMTKNAELARADLTQKVLLLGTSAKAIAEPELEIENNEVKATHAASVGQIDRRQIEFLTRRGFTRQQAIRILVQAFAEDVLITLDEADRTEKQAQLDTILESLTDEF